MRVAIDPAEADKLHVDAVTCLNRQDVKVLITKIQEAADFLWPPNKEPGLFDDGNGIVEAEAAWGRNQRDKSWAERSGLK